jgi:hypothetical protein
VRWWIRHSHFCFMNYYYYYCYYYFKIYSRLLVIRWRSFGKSRSQKQIKAICPITYRMICAVLISVIFCSSVADGWTGSKWRFWSKPVLIVPNAPIIIGKFLSSLPKCCWPRTLHLICFTVSFVLKCKSSGVVISISRKVLVFYHVVIYKVGFLLLLLLGFSKHVL